VSFKNSIMLTLTVVSIFLLLFFVVFGENGSIDLNRLKVERDRLLQKNAELKQENISLYREIDRLKNDPKYLENVARQELGVIGKDEVIFKVKKPKKAGKN
jgi:cell division protein FtsB